MRAFILTALCVFGVSLHAQQVPPPKVGEVPTFEGKYVFQGNYQVLRKMEAYAISGSDAESEELINKLLGQGFRCHSQTDDAFLCQKESVVDSRDRLEVDDLVLEQCKAEALDFRSVYDPTEGILDTGFLRSFRVFQKVIRSNPEGAEQIVSQIIYNWNSTGRWWVTFPTTDASFIYDLILPDQKQLKRFLTVEKSETLRSNVTAKRSYQVEVAFTRE